MKRGTFTSAKADKLFSKYIRDRDRYCFFSRIGCPNPGTQNSHFWGRGHSSTRYDPLNCDAACGGCHMRHEGNKQGIYADLKLEQLGAQAYDALRRRAYSIVKRSDALKECERFLSTLPPRDGMDVVF